MASPPQGDAHTTSRLFCTQIQHQCPTRRKLDAKRSQRLAFIFQEISARQQPLCAEPVQIGAKATPNCTIVVRFWASRTHNRMTHQSRPQAREPRHRNGHSGLLQHCQHHRNHRAIGIKPNRSTVCRHSGFANSGLLISQQIWQTCLAAVARQSPQPLEIRRFWSLCLLRRTTSIVATPHSNYASQAHRMRSLRLTWCVLFGRLAV